jgi:hypothetical protein
MALIKLLPYFRIKFLDIFAVILGAAMVLFFAPVLATLLPAATASCDPISLGKFDFERLGPVVLLV